MTDQLTSDKLWQWRQRFFPPEACLRPVITLHFHPQADGPLYMSETDIQHIDDNHPPPKIRPVEGVGMVDRRGIGHVLLLQKQIDAQAGGLSGLSEQLWDRYTSLEGDGRWPSVEFGRLLEIDGFIRADVLKFGTVQSESTRPV